MAQGNPAPPFQVWPSSWPPSYTVFAIEQQGASDRDAHRRRERRVGHSSLAASSYFHTFDFAVLGGALASCLRGEPPPEPPPQPQARFISCPRLPKDRSEWWEGLAPPGPPSLQGLPDGRWPLSPQRTRSWSLVTRWSSPPTRAPSSPVTTSTSWAASW